VRKTIKALKTATFGRINSAKAFADSQIAIPNWYRHGIIDKCHLPMTEVTGLRELKTMKSLDDNPYGLSETIQITSAKNAAKGENPCQRLP
jgi:hypothetical protein